MKIWKLMMMLFVLSATSVAFTACDKEDKDEQAAQSQNALIVGTWVDVESDWTLTFNANSTYTERVPSEGYYGGGTYTFDGKTIYMSDEDYETWVATYESRRDVIVYEEGTEFIRAGKK